MQKSSIRRQIVEAELHDQFYSDKLIRRSNFAIRYAGFCDLTRDGRAPSTLGCASFDAFYQHGKLRRGQHHRAAGIAHSRPDEAALIKPLAEQAKPIAVSEQDLQRARLLASKGKQVARRMDLS